jgi:hypothetical protein
MIQARIEGLRDILRLDVQGFRERLHKAAGEIKVDPPTDLAINGWWEQARTLEEE